MIMLYIIIILIGGFPLWRTLRFVRLEEKIRKSGIATSGVVANIHTVRHYKGPVTDRVHVRYNSIIPGRYHEANFVTAHSRYRIGQTVPVKYIPEQPDKIVVASTRGYWPMLIFTILLFLFVFFAVYKIDEMVKEDGQISALYLHREI